MLKVTTCLKESLPALTRVMRCLYVGMGEEPVGRPSTKGRSAVGAKSVILRGDGERSGLVAAGDATTYLLAM